MSTHNKKQPSKKKVAPKTHERRLLSNGELRIKQSADGKTKIVGYAAKFVPARSENLGGFFEEINSHAFDACLASAPDVRALWNHDANHILGRTVAGTLRLSTDSTGLLYEIDPPDTTVANDLMVSMERGDVTQSSFGFICTDDAWREDVNGNIIRTVLRAELFDVSPVTYPAYPDATSGVRTSLRSCPEGFRAKLKRDDLDDDSDCDPDIDDDCDNDDEDRCACRCGLADCASLTDDDDDGADDVEEDSRSLLSSLLLRRMQS